METKRFTNTSFPWLVGGYEMGKLIRSIDWSSNPLGSIDTWPQSLRATLNIILNSAVPMCLFWGPEFICFYNDAFQPAFVEKETYPLVMGQPGHVVWTEVWPVVKPLLDHVLEKGESTLSSDQLLPTYRNGQLEDAYWTLRYSPAFDDSAKLAGVIITGSETAPLRQLTENRDQLFFAIDAAELGTWDLNLSTHQFTANDRYKEWLGLPPKAGVELSTVLDAVSETDREHVAKAIWKALQPHSTSQYDVIYTLNNVSTEQKRTVRAKGRAYFSQDGKPYRFAGIVQDITEQVTAHEQMKQAEELAKLALEGANAGSFFIDLTDNSIIHSATLGRVFTGRDVEGMTRAQLLTYIHPDDLLIRERAYQEAARTGRLSYKVRTIWYDDSIHWLKVHGTYSRNVQGIFTRFSGIAQDITDEVIAQQEQQKLLSLVENSADYMAVSDNEGQLVYLNQAGRTLLGLDETQDLANLTLWDFYVPQVSLAHVGIPSLTGSTQVVYLRPFKSDDIIPCQATYVTITDPITGQQIGQGATLHDLRPELASRNELIESEASLQQLNQRLEMALEAARLGSYEVDWASDRITCTTQCKANFGLPANASITLSDIINLIVPDDRQRVEQVIAESVRLQTVYNAEYQVTWPDGSLHWIRASGRNTYDDTGKPLQMVGVTLDITFEQTAHQRLERLVDERTKELKTANQALLRTNNELEQFAYIASHDLQEPLRKIQNFISLLQESQQEQKQVDLYLDKIAKSAQRMSALIKAVLNYSRLAKTNELFEWVDLNDSLQSILTDYELLIEQKGAIIQFDTLPTVQGIPLQITQLLSNLIGNSLKFTSAEPRIELSTGAATPEEVNQHPDLNPALSYIWLIIRDNGIGFDQQYANRIFTLFQRLGNDKLYSGTGIGLALCKRIVDNHSGAISAHGSPGEGSTFTVYLPVTQPSQADQTT